MQELYATVPVVLGDSCLAGESHRYWSDRVPETLGRGGLLIHPMVDGMTSWYYGEMEMAEDADGDEFTVYPEFLSYELGRFDEAVETAKWALADAHAARAIRAQGRATVLARDTYAHRMGTVLAVAEGIHGGYREPTWERASPEVEREAGVSFSLVAVHHERIDPNANPPGFLIPDPPPTARHSVQLHRWSAIFEPRPGTTDSEVVEEVWGSNDYRVTPRGFSGTVVDIGANVGAFSVLAAKAGAKRVLAFEPEHGNYDRLLRNVEANRVRGVECLRQAITDGATESVFLTGSGGGARTVMTSSLPHGEAPTTTLRRVLSTIGGAEFLKMDIEGGEYEAFAACPVELLAHVVAIALEFHGPGMPHLSHLDDDGKHLERWGALVAKLADAGRVETFGHPMRGGLIHWKRYGA